MVGLGLETLNDVLARVTANGSKPVMKWQDATGTWQEITSEQLYGRVRALAAVLKAWGVAKGDRVMILSENRWEWAVADFAALAIGAVDVPIYSTLAADQIGYMLQNSGAKVAIVSSKEQFEKLASAGDLPALEHVIVMDDGNFADAENLSSLLADAPQLQARDASFDAMLKETKPEDLATVIYTSGTTGTPKGVMLTHHNLASNINLAVPQFGVDHDDVIISYLPLSHVFERHVDYAMMAIGAMVAYCAKFDQLPQAMKAIRPTFFVGVPRVFEKVKQGVEHKSTGFKKTILTWALGVGKAHREEVVQGKQPGGLLYGIANKLVFSKIQEAFGGRVKSFVSGSAALGMDTAGWFADAGIRIFEGFGLTETSPVVSFNCPGANKLGTIGRSLENVQVRFAPDGEMELKGPSVFSGYWQNPEATAKEFTPDGWFKTGDIGQIDGDGYLSITDRKKDILKTSGGKMIAPQPIEGKLKSNSLVAEAAVVGENHKFACVLIAPNFPALESWARGQGVSTSDHAALVKDPKVVAEYKRIVDETNKTLSHHETLKRVTVVPDEWSIESGELTPSMKLKRKVVEKKYEKEIAEFYADEASAKG